MLKYIVACCINSAAGFLLLNVSKSVEAMGDAAPFAAAGVSVERLIYHGLALLVLIGALVFIIRALLSLRHLFSST